MNLIVGFITFGSCLYIVLSHLFQSLGMKTKMEFFHVTINFFLVGVLGAEIGVGLTIMRWPHVLEIFNRFFVFEKECKFWANTKPEAIFIYI